MTLVEGGSGACGASYGVPWLVLRTGTPPNAQIKDVAQKLRIARSSIGEARIKTGRPSLGCERAPDWACAWIVRLAVLKLDWAYGFGAAARGGSRGKFCFNVGLNVPN
jgi:hypothetical protein